MGDPPRKLSIDPNSVDFNPCYVRVGVRIDGIERTDLLSYNMDRFEYVTTGSNSPVWAQSVEPYWRYMPSRQQRRLEERWEGKRK